MSACFLTKIYTVTNLVEYLDKRTENFDKGVQTDIIYLDYSKCFDSSVHGKLMYISLPCMVLQAVPTIGLKFF